jgi:hypothetical protein
MKGMETKAEMVGLKQIGPYGVIGLIVVLGYFAVCGIILG